MLAPRQIRPPRGGQRKNLVRGEYYLPDKIKERPERQAARVGQSGRRN